MTLITGRMANAVYGSKCVRIYLKMTAYYRQSRKIMELLKPKTASQRVVTRRYQCTLTINKGSTRSQRPAEEPMETCDREMTPALFRLI